MIVGEEVICDVLGEIAGTMTLLTFSLLISKDFLVLLSFLSDCSVSIPSTKCAENTAIAGEIRNKPEILAN